MDPLADFVGLTDVALRRRREPVHGLFVAEGAQVVLRALAAGYVPRTLVVAADRLARPDVAEAVSGVQASGGNVVVDQDDRLSAVAGYDVHRGVLASFERRSLPSVSQAAAEARTLLVLEAVVDHTNVGAAVRSAVALGADAVVLDPRCADPLYRRAIRTSMGAVFALPHARCPAWPGGLVELREAGFTLLALAPLAGASLSDVTVAPGERVALLLGTEGQGLSRRALAAADATVAIPMAHNVDSLNVATSAAVALWAIAAARARCGPHQDR